MPEQKSFWKKYEWLIIATVTLLLIYAIVVSNQKINFFLGNELIVYLAPNQQSFSTHYNELSKAQFDVSIDNAAYCKAACSYSFNDKSTNNLVDKGDFEIQKGQHFTKEYGLSVKRLGSGQDIYSFEVRCRSMRSFFCLTKGIEKPRSSFITVNYDLTETEKELKKILKQNFTMLLELLSDADVLHQQLNQKYFELSFKVNLNNLTKDKISIDDQYDKTRISIENLRSLWAVENYIELNQMFNSGFFEALGKIKASIEDVDKKIDGAVKLHNGLLSELRILNNNLNELSGFVVMLDDIKISNDFAVNIKKFNDAASSITNNTFASYGNVIREIGDITKGQESIIEESKNASAALFFNFEYLIGMEEDLLCSLKQDCSKNISIADAIKNTEVFAEKYPNAALLGQSCNSLEELEQRHSMIINETLSFISNNSIVFPSGSEFLEVANNFKANIIRKINNSYLDSFEKINAENKTSQLVIEAADAILPKNKTEISPLDYNESINLSLHLLSKTRLSDDSSRLLSKCQNLKQIEIADFDFKPINASITYKVISKIDTKLSDNPPVCCVFNSCKPCCNDDSCRNDPKTFPILFIHGHSFAKGNSPEFSLDAFNKIQSRLQDDGYLDAGIISLYSKNEPLQKGTWGLSGKPVTVKASYYYDAFRKEDKYIVVPTKSENIDTYALRLRDLIAIVKERTNKPKVNIIAHSMGGLVVRRYIQIFGKDDIEKFIMIAVPNNGISGAASDYCGIIGESRECQDMQENSLFINKLNDPLKQPANSKLYSIIGQGCQMSQDNGDGVVLAESAKLKDAKVFYVNGTCGGLFGENLHTEILNIEKYPEAYGIIKGILKE